MVTGEEPSSCEILSAKEAKITFKAQNNLVLEGNITNFVNPSSIKQMNYLHIGLYSKRRVLLLQDANLSLKSFVPASCKVTLSSSSNVIGDKDQLIKITIEPTTEMKATGIVVLTVPEYYIGAGQDALITAPRPEPCSSKDALISTCKFNTRRRQLTIGYQFKNGEDRTEPSTFEVGQFNNPIVQDQDGFFVEIMDDFEFTVALSDSLVLSGITEPVDFESYDFNFVDTAASGQLAEHQFIIKSSMPIQKDCRLKIVYPQEYTVNEKLTFIYGSGFFAPLGGAVDFTANYTENSVEIIGCQRNHGIFTSGIVSLLRVLN